MGFFLLLLVVKYNIIHIFTTIIKLLRKIKNSKMVAVNTKHRTFVSVGLCNDNLAQRTETLTSRWHATF